jgi:hypothetical protein
MNTIVTAFLLGSLAFASAPAGAQGLLSGGDSSNSQGYGSASSTSGITTTVTGPNGLDYTGSLGIAVSAGSSPSATGSSAVTGGYGGGSSDGTLTVTDTNSTESIQKGPASMSAGVSILMATEAVNGKTYPVAVDVAVGVARTTPFGSVANTFVIGGGFPAAGGITSTVITHK